MKASDAHNKHGSQGAVGQHTLGLLNMIVSLRSFHMQTLAVAAASCILSSWNWAHAHSDNHVSGSSSLFDIEVDLENRVATIDGILNPQLADRLEALESDIEAISITSPGGAPYTAHRIAQLANENDWLISFDGFCASACISLFLQTENVSVGSDALFVAHSQLAGRIYMITRTVEWSEREVANYETGAIDQALNFVNLAQAHEPAELSDYGLESTAAIGPTCAGGITDSGFELSRGGELLFQSEYEYWLPTQETLTRWRGSLNEAAGIELFDETLEGRLRRQIDFIASVNVRPILRDDQVQLAGGWFRAQDRFELCE